MKRHHFIVSSLEKGNKITVSDSALIRQWRNVLHLKIGEEVILADGQGEEVRGRIAGFFGETATVEIIETKENTVGARRTVTLYAAIVKRDNFEWIVQKATEVGVQKIVPMITSRTIKLGLSEARLKKIAKEAAEQSGRANALEITEPLHFKEALAQAERDEDSVIFLDFGGESLLEGELPGKRIGLMVGPEGGFTAEEHALALAKNFSVRSLGPLTLRAETAAVVASYLAGFLPSE